MIEWAVFGIGLLAGVAGTLGCMALFMRDEPLTRAQRDAAMIDIGRASFECEQRLARNDRDKDPLYGVVPEPPPQHQRRQ